MHRLVQNVQRIDAIFFFQCFCFLCHFHLQRGSGIEVIRLESFLQAGAEAFLILCILSELDALRLDGFPAFFIDLIVVIELLISSDSQFGARNDPIDQLILDRKSVV